MAHTFSQSQRFFARAEKGIAGGVSSGIRKLEQPVPLYFSRGQGARLWATPRSAHLRRCLLEEGVRAIERGLWFLCLEHTEADIGEALARASRAMARHAGEWKP